MYTGPMCAVHRAVFTKQMLFMDIWSRCSHQSTSRGDSSQMPLQVHMETMQCNNPPVGFQPAACDYSKSMSNLQGLPDCIGVWWSIHVCFWTAKQAITWLLVRTQPSVVGHQGALTLTGSAICFRVVIRFSKCMKDKRHTLALLNTRF